MIAGPTGSGKTVCLSTILNNRDNMISPPPQRIIYCYARWQPAFNNMPGIDFKEGILDMDELDPTINNLVILDDLMQESQNDKSILNLFTTDSHHKNISVFFLSQNLFNQGKYSRTISLNCHYLIVLNNPRDKSQINFLARQMFPTNSKFLVECYEDATSKPHGYLFLDFKQSTEEKFRVQSGILPGEHRVVYQTKKF